MLVNSFHPHDAASITWVVVYYPLVDPASGWNNEGKARCHSSPIYSHLHQAALAELHVLSLPRSRNEYVSVVNLSIWYKSPHPRRKKYLICSVGKTLTYSSALLATNWNNLFDILPNSRFYLRPCPPKPVQLIHFSESVKISQRRVLMSCVKDPLNQCKSKAQITDGMIAADDSINFLELYADV